MYQGSFLPSELVVPEDVLPHLTEGMSLECLVFKSLDQYYRQEFSFVIHVAKTKWTYFFDLNELFE